MATPVPGLRRETEVKHTPQKDSKYQPSTHRGPRSSTYIFVPRTFFLLQNVNL